MGPHTEPAGPNGRGAKCPSTQPVVWNRDIRMSPLSSHGLPTEHPTTTHIPLAYGGLSHQHLPTPSLNFAFCRSGCPPQLALAGG